jgi:hypothetical protein
VLRAPAGFAVSTVRDEIARGVLREAAARAGVEWLEAGDASAPGSDPHGRRGDAVLTRAERGSASAPLVEAEVHLGARSWPLRLPASVPAFHDPAIAASFAVWSRLFPEAPDRVPQPFTPEPPSLPGRAELLLDPVDGGTWLLDGAHTPASFRALAEEYARRFPGDRCGLVFATASDKCWQSGLSALLPIVDDLCVPRMPGTRWANPEAIALQARRLGSTRTEVSNDLRSAIAALRARAPRGRRLVCGSFYLVRGRAGRTAESDAAMSHDADPHLQSTHTGPVFVEDLLLTDTFLVKGRVTPKSRRLRQVLEDHSGGFLALEDVTMVALVGNEVIHTPRVLVAAREVIAAHELVEIAGDDVQRKLAAPAKTSRIRAFYNGHVQLEFSGLVEPHAYEPAHNAGRGWFVMDEPRIRGLDLEGNRELAILKKLDYAIVRKDRLAYVYDFS